MDDHPIYPYGEKPAIGGRRFGLRMALSSCLVCSIFRVQRTVTRCCRSGGVGLIPHLKSVGEFGSVVSGSHPVPRWPEVRGDTTGSGEEPRCAEPMERNPFIARFRFRFRCLVG